MGIEPLVPGSGIEGFLPAEEVSPAEKTPGWTGKDSLAMMVLF
jgi:hypothetical protein